MLLIILGVGITLLVGYVIYIITSSYGSDYSDNSLDAFIDKDKIITGESVSAADVVNQYYRRYDNIGRQVLVLYGTEYGYGEEVARELFDRLECVGNVNDTYPWQPRLVDMKQHAVVDLSQEQLVLIVVSTAGDGVPPTDARPFFDELVTSTEDYSHLRYSVLALGDSSYIHFCQAGKDIDQRLQALGGQRLVDRHEVDREDRSIVSAWFDRVLQSLDTVHVEARMDYLQISPTEVEEGCGRHKPFMATLKVKRELTERISSEDKETIHCEFDVTGSGITWTAGDAVGIYPQNNPGECDGLLKAMYCTGCEEIDVPKWAYEPRPDRKISLRQALLHYFDLKNMRCSLLELLRDNSIGTSDQNEIKLLLSAGTSKENILLHQYLYEREVADILCDFPEATKGVILAELLQTLAPLHPRYYSISSSPILDACTVSVTAAVIRYTTLDKPRTGVATTFLQDRLNPGKSCPLFISKNPHFRLPGDSSRPIVMIGPGTGLAPFRAFIQERVSDVATGTNRLYFGCRHECRDFLYKAELESWVRDGRLVLRTAFSRDQARKVYVQDMLREDSSIVWKMINEESAHVYVCGDAKRMSRDVHDVLLGICTTDGHMSEVDAATYLSKLESENRYQKDVWVT